MTLLDRAGALLPAARLRSRDAIHLVSALVLGTELTALVSYDDRRTDAARTLGLPVIGPGQANQLSAAT
jgi:hypothetical protein